VFWVPGRGTAWRHIPGRQATQSVLAIFLGLLMRRLAGLVEPPGGAGYFDSFLGFLEFWVKSDRGKRQ